ncbi:hypothetical protein ACVDG5_010845 [Mesorhizobium sp. ORM6]
MEHAFNRLCHFFASAFCTRSDRGDCHMPAPLGNRFWEARSSHGRAPIFATPDDLFAVCCEYFEPNSGVIIRWANEQMLEYIVGWVVEADAAACLAAIHLDHASVTVADLVARLKSENRAAHGLKKDTSSYEIIAGAIGANDACCARARSLLNAITDVAKGGNSPMFVADAGNPAIKVFQP